jgi:hypothetical protein
VYQNLPNATRLLSQAGAVKVERNPSPADKPQDGLPDGFLFSGNRLRACCALFFDRRLTSLERNTWLDLMDPGGRGGREMGMETRRADQPVSHRPCLVRTGVVHHPMNIEIIWNVGFDRAQKAQELAATVASVQ